jgi:hypothetical protein
MSSDNVKHRKFPSFHCQVFQSVQKHMQKLWKMEQRKALVPSLKLELEIGNSWTFFLATLAWSLHFCGDLTPLEAKIIPYLIDHHMGCASIQT